MTTFEIKFTRAPSQPLDGPHRLQIRAGMQCLTRLRRAGQQSEDTWAMLPPTSLAFWLLDNWWRLNYEPAPRGQWPADWRNAHDTSSVGGGYAWPQIAFFGEGARVGIVSKRTSNPQQSRIAYLADALVYVASADFATEVDRFVDSVLTSREPLGSDTDALARLVAALSKERTDPEIAQWRRYEAMSGFDPDGAPDELMEGIAQLLERYEEADVDEFAVATTQPGLRVSDLCLDAVEEIQSHSNAFEADFRDIVRIINRENASLPSEPWQKAEAVADALRYQFGIRYKPIRNKWLSELLGVSSSAFVTDRSRVPARSTFGLRVRKSEDGVQTVYFATKKSAARRFEAACMLGDVIWSLNSSIGPIVWTQTARQKFQRAFAASLLCPHRALVSFLNTDEPSDDQIVEAATYFHVSNNVVRTILVNKKIVDRTRLNLPFADLSADVGPETLVEAA